MRTVHMHLPEAQVPVPAVFNATAAKPAPATEQNYVYLCFHLWDEFISPALSSRLSAWGVECIAPGEQFTAYGIAPEDADLLELFESDDEIISVERHEPSAGK